MGQKELTLKNYSEQELVFQSRDDGLFIDDQAVEYTFDGIFHHFKNLVFNLAYRLLSNHDDALELTQEVFFTVYRKLNTFRGRSSIKTWIYRITLNKASNRLRRWNVRCRKHTLSFQAMDYFTRMSLNLKLSRSIPTPEQACIRSETMDIFQECLQKLAFKYRSIIIMRDMEDLTYEEIAKNLRISLGTVKSRIARAREQLRRHLEKKM